MKKIALVFLVALLTITLVGCSKTLESERSTYAIKVGEEVVVNVTLNGEAATGVTFDSLHPAIATVEQDGTVTGVSGGVADITATYKDQTITVKVAVMDYGLEYVYTAVTGSGNATSFNVSVSDTNYSIVTYLYVNGTYLYTARNASSGVQYEERGTYTISMYSGSENWQTINFVSQVNVMTGTKNWNFSQNRTGSSIVIPEGVRWVAGEGSPLITTVNILPTMTFKGLLDGVLPEEMKNDNLKQAYSMRLQPAELAPTFFYALYLYSDNTYIWTFASNEGNNYEKGTFAFKSGENWDNWTELSMTAPHEIASGVTQWTMTKGVNGVTNSARSAIKFEEGSAVPALSPQVFTLTFSK